MTCPPVPAALGTQPYLRVFTLWTAAAAASLAGLGIEARRYRP